MYAMVKNQAGDLDLKRVRVGVEREKELVIER